MSVLDDIIVGVRDDLARRELALGLPELTARLGDVEPARDPMPAFRAPGASVISEVRSTSRSLSRTWYRRASACSCASSSDATGEHRTHWSTCSFQHTSPHTQSPQPRHWWKCGEISVTALFRALSFASEFVDRSSNRSAAEVTP